LTSLAYFWLVGWLAGCLAVQFGDRDRGGGVSGVAVVAVIFVAFCWSKPNYNDNE